MNKLAAFVVGVVLTFNSARAADFTYTTIQVGTEYTIAVDANDSGQVSGIYVGSSPTWRGFVMSDGNFIPIDVPGASMTIVQRINDFGEITGYYTASGVTHSFVERIPGDPSSILSFDIPGALPNSTNAFGINDLGWVAGVYHDSVGAHGFVAMNPGESDMEVKSFDLSALGAVGDPAVLGINDSGVVVGYWYDGNNGHGFVDPNLDDPSSIYSFDAPGGNTILSDINDNGQIVGFAGGHDFVFTLGDPGSFSTFDVPGETTEPWGISDLGAVAGAGSGAEGFLAEPIQIAAVPEPSSLVVLMAGLLGVTGARKLRAARPASSA